MNSENTCILNVNLAQIPVIHIDVLLTPKKKAILPLASMYEILQCVYLFYKVVNNPIPSLRQVVSILRDNINIFINVT